jgi:predicted PurR-regulated permease PerM
MLFTFFFFLRDGDKILDSLLSFSPFEKEKNKEIVGSVYKTIVSVMRGTLLVGLIRFILITAIFYLLGIPDALLWGSLGGIIGLIPGLGTPFVIIPAITYFVFYSNNFSALLMAIFGIMISVLVDNMLAAHYFGKGLDVPPLFVLFSILGGIFFFGPLGFIFGPIVLSLFISMVDIYRNLILKK